MVSRTWHLSPLCRICAHHSATNTVHELTGCLSAKIRSTGIACRFGRGCEVPLQLAGQKLRAAIAEGPVRVRVLHDGDHHVGG
jgi:hypothetical protein